MTMRPSWLGDGRGGKRRGEKGERGKGGQEGEGGWGEKVERGKVDRRERGWRGERMEGERWMWGEERGERVRKGEGYGSCGHEKTHLV